MTHNSSFTLAVDVNSWIGQQSHYQ